MQITDALTVEELIEYLKDENPKARVAFICDYGDYGHTQQALPVVTVEGIDQSWQHIEESAYSQSRLALYEREDEDEEEGEEEDEEEGEQPVVAEEADPVVVLRM